MTALGPSHLDRPPYGLWSLWDMLNAHITGLCSLCAQLMLEETSRSSAYITAEALDSPIGEKQRERARGWLKIATNIANDFEWSTVDDRVEIFTKKLRSPLSNRDFATEFRVLRETIDAASKGQFIYRYPNEKSVVLLRWKDDWEQVRLKFPSSETDILPAVDLWALGHSTASVFHCMRVLEHGLRALAEDVGRTFDVQQWHNIIEEIESSIVTIRKSLPRGAEKNDRLQFLSEAAKEFVYFKDGWRNYVSHGRGSYDEHQARSVMNHVRVFMTGLSSRLSENAELAT
jgi:hypothetical protein